jgi:hypothetical protein
MTRAQLRQRMRAQRAALRAAMARLRQQASARVGATPAVRRQNRTRRLGRTLGGLLVLALLLLLRCQCEVPEGAPASPPAQAAVPVEVEVEPAVPPRPARRPLEAALPSQPRGAYRGEVRAPPSWLDDFRLQVAARSPRLSSCFQGSDRPGALRWTAAVNPHSGAVSDHELEPLGVTSVLDGAQRRCLLEALSHPTYRLRAGEPAALPDRVGIVIEF